VQGIIANEFAKRAAYLPLDADQSAVLPSAPSVAAGQSVGLSFVPVLSTTPTGLTFHQISATNVGSGPSVTAGSMTPYGWEVTVTAAATGVVAWTGTYPTVGA
jgi:hypothetical protein